jgi:hypothetical protein
MVARSRRHFQIEFDENSISRLNNLANAMALYPNRIDKAIHDAAKKTEKDTKDKLRTNYRNTKLAREDVVPVKVYINGNNIKIKASVLWAEPNPNAVTQNDTTRARFHANIMLRGRRRYTAKRSKLDDPYNLVKWSSGAIEYAYGFTVPAKSPNYQFRKFITGGMISKMFKKNLTKALANQGIGGRGGTSRVTRGDNPV